MVCGERVGMERSGENDTMRLIMDEDKRCDAKKL